MRCCTRYLIALVFVSSFASAANETLQVENLRILSKTFSSVHAEIQFLYDGSKGDRVNFGVTALTRESVNKVGFRPNVMSKGHNKLVVIIGRPAVLHQQTLVSDRLDFHIYTQHTSQHVVVNHQIEWPSFASMYADKLAESESRDIFTTIEWVRINEALANSDMLIKGFNYHGLGPHRFNIFFKPLDNPNSRNVSLRISEGVGLADLKLLVELVTVINLSIQNIDFIAKTNTELPYGFVDILETHFDGLGFDSQQTLEAIKNQHDIAKVYKAAGFKPTITALSNDELLSKASGLIRVGGPKQLKEANKILVELMVQGDWRINVFWQYLQSLIRPYPFPFWVWGALLVMCYLPMSLVYRRFIKKPDIENLSVRDDDPEIIKQIAKARAQLHRLFKGLDQGTMETFVKVPVTLGDKRCSIWAVVHAQKDSEMIISVENDPEVAELVSGRRRVAVKDIQDWMLVNEKGEKYGGFTFLAIAKCYEAKYGVLPKRYRQFYKSFQDFSL